MRRLYLLQIHMLLMVLCSMAAIVAPDEEYGSLRDMYLLLAGGWGALGALMLPPRHDAPRRDYASTPVQDAAGSRR